MANKSDNWSNLLHSDDTARKMEGPTTWDKVAASLAGVANFATGFASEQLFVAGQDVVSRVLLGESFHPETGKERDAEPEKRDVDKRDLDKDTELER